MNQPAMNKNSLMQKIMETSFYLVDLNLYLDTHPDDSNAIANYDSIRNAYNRYVLEYAHHYGPITANQVTQDNYWSWVATDWPWEGGCG